MPHHDGLLLVFQFPEEDTQPESQEHKALWDELELALREDAAPVPTPVPAPGAGSCHVVGLWSQAINATGMGAGTVEATRARTGAGTGAAFSRKAGSSSSQSALCS